MSLLKKVFSRKKELSGEDIKMLLEVILVDRDPVILATTSLKAVSEILETREDQIHVRNTLTRDEVLYQIKGKPIRISFPYELTLFCGDTRLMGLGMVRGMHTLKLSIPQVLKQEESRGAYRVSNFVETPTVTFTNNEADILQARLSDISMTGAGLRLDPRQGPSNLQARSSIIIDIQIDSTLRISTSAKVRYVKGNKVGLQFDDLQKTTKDRLFKYIVARRREEYRALMRTREQVRATASADPLQGQSEDGSVSLPPPEEREKPAALIAGEDQEAMAFLEGILNRKFMLTQVEPSFAEIRRLALQKPDLALFELPVDQLERVSQMKKAGALLPKSCVLMFFGENFTTEFHSRFLGEGYPSEMMVDLQTRNKLMLFKQIERFFAERGRN